MACRNLMYLAILGVIMSISALKVCAETTESALDLDDAMTTAGSDSDWDDDQWGPDNGALHVCQTPFILIMMSALLLLAFK